MADVTVTVTGPGGVITYEMIVIQRALEAAGVRVTVIDEHPADNEEEWVVEMNGQHHTRGVKKLTAPLN